VNLRSWLRKSPVPVSVRITPHDGEASVFVIDQADPRKWARAVESIEAMGPRKLEALDRKSQVIRATLVDGDEEPEESKGPPTPLTQSRLGELALHLNVAAKQGGDQVREATKDAQEAMVRVTGVAVASLEKAAASIERLSKRLEQVSARTGPEEEEDVPTMLMQGLMMRQLGMGGGMGAMLGRGKRPSIPTGGDEGEAIEPTPEEEQEIGQFFLGLMKRRMEKDAAARKAPANGVAKTPPKTEGK